MSGAGLINATGKRSTFSSNRLLKDYTSRRQNIFDSCGAASVTRAKLYCWGSAGRSPEMSQCSERSFLWYCNCFSRDRVRRYRQSNRTSPGVEFRYHAVVPGRWRFPALNDTRRWVLRRRSFLYRWCTCYSFRCRHSRPHTPSPCRRRGLGRSDRRCALIAGGFQRGHLRCGRSGAAIVSRTITLVPPCPLAATRAFCSVTRAFCAA